MRKNSYLYMVIVGCSLLIAGVLWAANEWEEKPYTEWSKETTVKMLTDSPWASRQVIQEEESPFESASPFPGGSQNRNETGPVTTPPTIPESGSSSGAGKARTYSITFMSARPIRMALARWALLSGNVNHAQADQFVSSNPYGDSIVVSVAVPPQQGESELENLDAEVLRNSSFLHLEKSDKKLSLSRYVPPSQSGNNGGLFFFPGTQDGKPTVSMEEEEIRFESRINRTTRLDQKFNLEKMVFEGKFEL